MFEFHFLSIIHILFTQNMRRLFLFIGFITVVFVSFAQVSVVGKHRHITDAAGVDHLVVFEKIDNSTVENAAEIHFKASSSDAYVRWFVVHKGVKTPLNTVNSVSTRETYIEPKTNTAYLIEEDGRAISCWITTRSDVDIQTGIQYETVDGSARKWNAEKRPEQLTALSRVDMRTDEDTIKISCKITTIATAREEKNENQRPNEKSIDGSAPLEIQFFSNPEGDVTNFLWQIYRDGSLVETRTDRDHRYTFEKSGKYRVSLQVSNATETASDSINVSVSESQLNAPNVFTPNGDGYNDEFRVAYVSISEFQATILNRWGRVVHSWNNPQEGWDGNIGGKPAAEGTYFYVITAKGADSKVHKLKGHINLLR